MLHIPGVFEIVVNTPVVDILVTQILLGLLEGFRFRPLKNIFDFLWVHMSTFGEDHKVKLFC